MLQAKTSKLSLTIHCSTILRAPGVLFQLMTWMTWTRTRSPIIVRLRRNGKRSPCRDKVWLALHLTKRSSTTDEQQCSNFNLLGYYTTLSVSKGLLSLAYSKPPGCLHTACIDRYTSLPDSIHLIAPFKRKLLPCWNSQRVSIWYLSILLNLWEVMRLAVLVEVSRASGKFLRTVC